jgi:hypothetical protein
LNAPGLSAISYRTGRWATFRESMLARLSSSQYPALSFLKTRDSDDFTIAFLDATSVMLDILTFYQERLANESYLRTATQLYSLIQLSQLIGYQPSPGVSAATYLAFTLRVPTGQPTDPTTMAITIPAGTQAQSVPAQGQTPQYFQTSADMLAKPDWNALQVQTGVPWIPKTSDTSVYLAGTATQLNPGDAVLIVGDERAIQNKNSPHWDLRFVTSVTTDAVNQRTLITWSEGLGGASGTPAQVNPKVYALRQKASLFGYNAVNPLMLAADTITALTNAHLIHGTTYAEWDFGTQSSDGTVLANSSIVDLDAVYSKVVNGGWLVTLRPHVSAGTPETAIYLYQLDSVSSISRSDYSVSAKITRAVADVNTGLAANYEHTRNTAAIAQSELLPAAEQPLTYPLYGTFLDLEVQRNDLAGVTAIAVTGTAQKIAVNLPATGGPNLQFVPDDGSKKVALAQGQVYTVTQPPNQLVSTGGNIADWNKNVAPVTLAVADSSGRTGTIANAQMQYFTLMLPSAKDPVVQESALVAQIQPIAQPFPFTRILLKTPLLHCYSRPATTVNANVVAATAGAPVAELLGSGSAATPNQQFQLKQKPLTYVQAATPTGSQSSLQVSVNGAKWTLAPTLYNQPPTAQVYTTLNLPGGTTQVQFGDGVEGATVPTGQGNIMATYRTGIGSAGNVGVGTITTLVDRPVGVSGVTNSSAATGGQNPQSVNDIRSNAPLSVLTLGRAVSITDYQNFAASFAGIAKASAFWIPSGAYRGVFLTVASAGGIELPPGNLTLGNLVGALHAYGNPRVAIYAQSFLETTFSVSADLTYDPAYNQPDVQAAVLRLLQDTYSFANRIFGQGVSSDEIAALIQGVSGVIAVNVTGLTVIATSPAGDIGSAGYSVSAYNAWTAQALTTPLLRPKAKGHLRICPYIPTVSPNQPNVLPNPAEILVLDPNPNNVKLGVMQ